MLYKEKKTKFTQVKSNGRSADITSPNFIYGCNGTCDYCYMHRNNENIYIYDDETVEIMIKNIYDWADKQVWPKVPNHIHPNLYMVDIGNACDIPLQYKYQNWSYIVDRICSHERLGITFATTYPSHNFQWWSSNLYHYDHRYGHKSRVRITIMPQEFSDICEPNGESIKSRISVIPQLRKKGWDVRYSFAPIIVTDGWTVHYNKLLKLLQPLPDPECIFLTALPNDVYFSKELMEEKQPTHGRRVWRYKHNYKKNYISVFKDMLESQLQIKPSYIF